MKLFFICLFFLWEIAHGRQPIVVGLEPFPPMVVDKHNGLTIKLLKEIEKISPMKFKVIILPYSRGKEALKSSVIQILGHTPFQMEEPEFYKYASELKFSIQTTGDFYFKHDPKLKNYKAARIGTPFGNEDFAAQLLDVPKSRFVVGEIENLVRMLDLNRIDLLWFERAATQSTIKKLNIEGIKYWSSKKFRVRAGLAVRNDKKGRALGKKLDDLIDRLDTKVIFRDHSRYQEMPDSGVVRVGKPTNHAGFHN